MEKIFGSTMRKMDYEKNIENLEVMFFKYKSKVFGGN
jgi:hypothetical protein